MLPRVWTLPSKNVPSPYAVWEVATTFVENIPALMGHFPNELYTDCIYHYDTAGDEPLAREHYRILVTTVLQESEGIVYVDALTEEVFGMVVVENKAE